MLASPSIVLRPCKLHALHGRGTASARSESPNREIKLSPATPGRQIAIHRQLQRSPRKRRVRIGVVRHHHGSQQQRARFLLGLAPVPAVRAPEASSGAFPSESSASSKAKFRGYRNATPYSGFEYTENADSRAAGFAGALGCLPAGAVASGPPASALSSPAEPLCSSIPPSPTPLRSQDLTTGSHATASSLPPRCHQPRDRDNAVRCPRLNH